MNLTFRNVEETLFKGLEDGHIQQNSHRRSLRRRKEGFAKDFRKHPLFLLMVQFFCKIYQIISVFYKFRAQKPYKMYYGIIVAQGI